MNDHEIERVAAAMNQLRPDWPVKSLKTLLARPELASRARRDITVALAWVACESASHTPARVLENGPWWKAAGITGEVTRRHATPETACQTCGREMHSPDLVCDEPTVRPAPSVSYAEHAAKAKALLRETR